MIPPAPSTMLRPLGFGEMLDRAVTLFVKNAALFTGLVFILAVPIQVMYFIIAGDPAARMMQSIAVITHPGSVPPSAMLQPSQTIATLLVVVVSLLLSPIIGNAVAIGVAQRYLGRGVSLFDCLKPAFARAFPTIGILLSAGFAFLLWYLATIIALALPAAAGIFFLKTFLPMAILFFGLGVILLLVAIAALVLLSFAVVFSLYALVIEACTFGAALRSGFARIFSKREMGRALLVGLTLLALELVIIIVSAILALLFIYFLHIGLVYVIASTVISSLWSAFLSVYLAVYYYDVRVRAEGFDLQMRLNAFAPDAPMP